MAYSQRMLRSKGQDLLSRLAKPWELAYLVFYMFSSLALTFISEMNLESASRLEKEAEEVISARMFWCDEPSLLLD